MLGTKVTNNILFNLFRIIWAIVAPIILVVSKIFSSLFVKEDFIDYFVKFYKALTVLALMSFGGLESGSYKYPYWSTIIGIILSSSTLYGVILYAIYYIVRYVIIDKQVPFKNF